MGSAKIVIKTQDRSAIVPSLPGIYAGISITARKGPLIPTLITSPEDLLEVYGTPDPTLGVSWYSAYNYLAQGNLLWVTRTAHADARYSAVTVRWKTDDLDTDYPPETYEPDRIVRPLLLGLTQSQVDSYVFEVSSTNRVYADSSANVLKDDITDLVRVNAFYDITSGDEVVISSTAIGSLTNSETKYTVDETVTIVAEYDALSITGVHAAFQMAGVVTAGSLSLAGAVIEKVTAPATYAPYVGAPVLALPANGTNVIYVSNATNVVNGDTIRIGGVGGQEIVLTTKTMNAPVLVANEGDAIHKVTAGPTYTAYTGNPTIGKATTNSSTLFALNADYIQNGDTIRIGGVGGQEVTFDEKNAYSEDTYWLQLNAVATVVTNNNVYLVVEDEFEDKDAFLVYSTNQSIDFNSISIAITPSTNYAKAFNLIVYYKGVKKETWEVSRENLLDGYQRQLFMEDKINGKSRFIKVKNNPNAVDVNEVPQLPLYTDFSLWRQNPDDIFVTSTLEIQENLLNGDVQVQFATDPALITGIEPNARVKFVIGENTELSAEYKIFSIDSINNFIILDRGIVETQISTQWQDGLGAYHNTLMYFFDATNQDAPNGIIDGIQHYNISVLPNVYYNYPLNSDFVISGNNGVLLDAGANLMTGGFGGSIATVSDVVNSLYLMKNKEKTPVTLLLDGGFTQPAVAQAILTVCQSQGLTHGYTSCDPTAEQAVDYKAAIVAYKNSTNLNTELVSMFTGWVKILDNYNQKEIYVAPDGFAAAAQSFTTREYNIFTPAAGWLRGKISALGVLTQYDEPDRDYLVDNRLNPIRYKEGSGLVIWGNETTLTRPSPLQLRSVSMLLIAIKYGLENMLEYKHFDLNNERTWTLVEGAVRGFMRDEIQAKGGVVDFQVAVKDVITNSDLSNRKMPLFLGITPTTDIQEIPVTLAIYNSGVDIEVAV